MSTHLSEPLQRLRARHFKPWFEYEGSSLRKQVVEEIKYHLRPPFEVLSVVLINVSLALGVWFFINPDLVMKHAAIIILPIALASWAYADVPSTNLLGSRAEQVRERLDDGVFLRRVMTVENLGLWVFISPACLLLSLGMLPAENEPLMSVAVAIAVMSLPFAYLGLAAILAPLLPFHPLPWRERLHRRDTWLRYGLAVGVAYLGLTWPAALISATPALIILGFVGQEPTHYVAAAVLITPWCFLVWRVGLHLSSAIVRRRRFWLDDFLADPTRG